MYSLTGENPIDYLRDLFITTDVEDYITRLAKIICAFSNNKITLKDLHLYILNNEDNKKSLSVGISNIICTELESEIKNEEVTEEDDKVNKNKTEDEEETDDLYAWVQYWDYYYYVATIVLHKTEEDFYDSSPREIKTLTDLDIRYKKNIEIETYITLNKPSEQEEEKIMCDSADSFFSMI